MTATKKTESFGKNGVVQLIVEKVNYSLKLIGSFLTYSVW